MQVTSISFFRFEGLWNKFWAFEHMGLARRPLRRLPGLTFLKMMGVGRGAGFNPAPNFGAYAFLATWTSMEAARDAVQSSRIFRRYDAHAAESWTIFLSASRSRGAWNRQHPFAIESELPASEPVGILTRASISWRRVWTFWGSVPPVSSMVLGAPGLRFNIGMGEWPISQLMTFSVWDDFEAAKSFAYRDGAHRRAMQRARTDGWFSEDLFVRFRLLGATGTWKGADPLAGLTLTDPARIAAARLAPGHHAPDRLSPARLSPDRLSPDRIGPRGDTSPSLPESETLEATGR